MLKWTTGRNGYGWSKVGGEGYSEMEMMETVLKKKKERERLLSWWDSENREHCEKAEEFEKSYKKLSYKN